jgi:hypothetical protein
MRERLFQTSRKTPAGRVVFSKDKPAANKQACAKEKRAGRQALL